MLGTNVSRAFAVVALLALSIAAPGSAQEKYDPRTLKAPPLRPIPNLPAEHFTLPNGVSVYLHEDHTLPVVKGILYVRNAVTMIPADKVGLGSITGDVMRSGGTAQHSGDWLDDHLASIGASIDTDIGQDLANGSFRCLSNDTRDVVALWAEVLEKPAFPEDKIELSKVGLRRAIAERNDEMIPLLIQVSREAVWGKDHPWARKPEYATVEAVKRGDCVGLWQKVFEPGRAAVAVYGDFHSADMKKLLTTALGGWKGPKAALPPQPPLPNVQQSKLVFAPKEDVTQSGIVLAEPGLRTDDPDAPAMEVFAMALGGGFQSRLINVIRTERGLAYATGATAGDGLQHPGVFLTYSLTKSESTMTALDLLRQETKRAVDAPFTDDELQTAKQSVMNQFVFNFEDPSEVLNRKAFYEVIGYPQDFLQRYQNGVSAVTPNTVYAAAKKHVHPDRLTAIVVGKEHDFERPLASAGLSLERVDITIPPPPSQVKVGEATPESRDQAKQWLSAAVAKAGGAAAWQAVKSVVIEQKNTISMQGQQLDVQATTTWQFPDRELVVQKAPMGEVRQGYDGAAGWRAMAGQTQDQPGMADRVKADYARSLFHIFAHPEELELQATPAQTADGASYNVAFVKSDVVRDWTLWFAPDGTLARMQFRADGPQGPATQTIIYSDWKPRGAISYPTRVQLLMDGKPFAEGQLVRFELNPALTAEAFKKPAP